MDAFISIALMSDLRKFSSSDQQTLKFNVHVISLDLMSLAEQVVEKTSPSSRAGISS